MKVKIWFKVNGIEYFKDIDLINLSEITNKLNFLIKGIESDGCKSIDDNIIHLVIDNKPVLDYSIDDDLKWKYVFSEILENGIQKAFENTVFNCSISNMFLNENNPSNGLITVIILNAKYLIAWEEGCYDKYDDCDIPMVPQVGEQAILCNKIVKEIFDKNWWGKYMVISDFETSDDYDIDLTINFNFDKK